MTLERCGYYATHMARCVRRSDDGNGQCTREAKPASILCSVCGGEDRDQQRREIAERTELAKLVSFNSLLAGVEEAIATYFSVMRNGEKDADRLRAADRILELAGFKTQGPLVAVQVNNTGLRQEDHRDARLLDVIRRLDAEKAEQIQARILDTVATEATGA